ncbi:MAG: hypothetical protein V4719_14655 [Planctomycetota bacterium]
MLGKDREHILGEETDESSHEALCWNLHQAGRPLFVDFAELFRAFDMFDRAREANMLLYHRQYVLEATREETVTLTRSQYQALIGRIEALEFRAKSDEQTSQTTIADTTTHSVLQLANQVFGIDNAACQVIESDDEPYMLVTIHVGPHADPEQMSARKTELHKMSAGLSLPAPRLMVKVIYG